MEIINPFQLNNWEIKKCFLFLFSLQFAFWGLIVLNALGIHLSILLQFIGIIYLNFVPGILLLRIFNLHKLSDVTVLVYAVGLSLTTLMLTGFCINLIFPMCGISRPISLWPLVFSISIVVVILSIFAYIKDRSFCSPEYIQLDEIICKPVLIFFLLPFGAIWGTYLFNTGDNNIILMIVYPLIALVPVVIFFTKIVQEKYYPYIIFILTITLLYLNSLISPYIWGWDINSEYYFVNFVVQNGIWDSTLFGNLNAMLSLTMLGPMYTLILNMDLDRVFKIIYPFLFAFVPLGLYAIFRKQMDNKVAFLACFFFISFFGFFTEMLQLARQEIAELFLVLIILSVIDKDLTKFSKNVFLLLFSSSLIVSHYGISYLFLLILIISWTVELGGYYLISRTYIGRVFVWFQGKSGYQNRIDLQNYFFRSGLFSLSSVLFFLYYCVFMIMWYMYTSGSSSLASAVRVGTRIFASTSDNFLDPEVTQGLAIVQTAPMTAIHEMSRNLHMLTLYLIIIGFLSSVILYKKVQLDRQYLLLSFGAICLCAGGLVLPFFSSSLNTTRVFQISIILLAPFCVLGGIFVFKVISKYVRTSDTNHKVKISLQILSIFFALYLLFNSAWFYEITKDHPTAFLNKTNDYPMVDTEQVAGAMWLADEVDGKLIYADNYRRLFFYRIYGQSKVNYLPEDPSEMPKSSYVFLGNFNIIYKRFYDYLDTDYVLTNRSRIFDNGGAEVYYQ